MLLLIFWQSAPPPLYTLSLHDALPISRCETTLSSHEVALGYEDVVDPGVYLKLALSGGEAKLLVWTTTPWTLPGNIARSEEHTSELQYVSISYAVFCLKKKRNPRKFMH